jgi:peptide-N4-(N-acetyl-beta-glucosaminyl)asparagine amidase
MRKLQKTIKSGQTNEQEIDIQEFILTELLSWFKDSFFSWVDSPECERCKGSTKFTGHDSSPSREGQAYRIEVS